MMDSEKEGSWSLDHGSKIMAQTHAKIRSMEAKLKAAEELVHRLEVRMSLSLPIGREILDALTEYRAAGK